MHSIIKKFFILKNAAVLCMLFFETCNYARFRAISYVMKNANDSSRSHWHCLLSAKINPAVPSYA